MSRLKTHGGKRFGRKDLLEGVGVNIGAPVSVYTVCFVRMHHVNMCAFVGVADAGAAIAAATCV